MKVKIFKTELDAYTGKIETKVIELDDVILIKINKQKEYETFLNTSFYTEDDIPINQIYEDNIEKITIA